MVLEMEKQVNYNNQAVRNYAYNKYKEMGLDTPEVQERMNRKDAGHIGT